MNLKCKYKNWVSLFFKKSKLINFFPESVSFFFWSRAEEKKKEYASKFSQWGQQCFWLALRFILKLHQHKKIPLYL